MKSIKY